MFTRLCQTIAQGWNTWTADNLLCHVRLPDALMISLGFKTYKHRAVLRRGLMGRQIESAENIKPLAHSWNGSYTALHLTWHDVEVLIETAATAQHWHARITPTAAASGKPPLLLIQAGLAWNRPGRIDRADSALLVKTGHAETCISCTETPLDEPYLELTAPALAVPLSCPIGISTDPASSLSEIDAFITAHKQKHRQRLSHYGPLADSFDAIQTALAWSLIYDPQHQQLLMPPSHIWNAHRAGGYAVFCWDSFFAALLTAIDNPSLASALVLSTCRLIREHGFVPNVCFATGRRSRDRSQPPIGAFVVREIYRRWRDPEIVGAVFDDLYRWNQWWKFQRSEGDLLCWGSNAFTPVIGDPLELEQPGTGKAAALESGLDNSPMYDDATYDSGRGLMNLADAGLNSLAILDDEALADLADILNKSTQADALRQSAARRKQTLQRLWNDELGMFCNRHTDTDTFSPRLSPTCFYPLLAGAASPVQARRMVHCTLMNEQHFAGFWMIPSVPRSDPAFPEQQYWRGRIWPPLNFLVYCGLRRSGFYDEARVLAEKSNTLLLRDWRDNNFVNENYNAITGRGGDNANSCPLYHWGGLLALPALIEAGLQPAPEHPLEVKTPCP